MEQAEALAQYKKLVKDKPEEKEGARRSFYDHFNVDPEAASFSRPKGDVSAKAEQHLSHMNPGADAAQPPAIGQALNKATGGLYGAVEKNVPMAAGMAATAGTSAGPLAVGALFASTKGLAEKAIGSDKSPRQAAKDFVWDTVMVAAPDKLLRTAAKVGGPLFERFVTSAATKTQEGENLLKTAENTAHDAVTKSPEVVGRTGDITAAYRKFVNYIDSLPHGEGVTGKVYGALQGEAKKLYEVASADLGAVDAATGLPRPAVQPLDALIRFESKWMQSAYNAAEGGVSGKSENAAAEAMKTFANEVRATIVRELPPKAKQMFEYAKGLTSARYEASATQAIAKTITGGFVRGILRDAYDLTGGPIVEKYAPVVLEQMLGSGPGLSLLKGLTSKVSNNPVALADAIKQGSKNLVQFIPVEIKDAIQREAKKVLDAVPKMSSMIEMPGGEAHAENAPANIREGQKYIEKEAPGAYGDPKMQEKMGMRRESARPAPVKAKDQKTIPPPGDPNEPLWLKAMRRQRGIRGGTL